MAEQPLSKDALAGRLRRLLSVADRAARQAGLPDTSEYLLAGDDTGASDLEARRSG